MSETSAKKPGWKTTEFWLSLAATALGAAVASGMIPADSVWMKVAGVAAAMLASLGYTGARALCKTKGK